MRRVVFPGVCVMAMAAAMAMLPGWCQEAGTERLNSSPRHHEWQTVTYGDRAVKTFIVYPEVKEKRPAVLVIHENRGLTDWVRSVADRLAEEGYIALAPDLLSGMAPDGGRTKDFADRNAARDALYEIPQAQVTADLNAVADYAKALPACDGKLMVAGFCWGGRQTFHYATERHDLAAAFVFYGTAPGDAKQLAGISCPVYGFYGGEDARVTSTVPATRERMAATQKAYGAEVYDGAGHGFMRAGEEPGASEANKEAHEKAWKRWLELLESATAP